MDTHHPFVPPKQFCNSNFYRINYAEDILCKNPHRVTQTELQNIVNLYDGTIMRTKDVALKEGQNAARILGVDNLICEELKTKELQYSVDLIERINKV